jgi:DNA-binding Xre family transcriptional regulator
MNKSKDISSKEIALAIGKTPSAISYLKKRNQDEFMLLKLGVLCNKLELTDEDLMAMYSLKNIQLKKIAS